MSSESDQLLESLLLQNAGNYPKLLELSEDSREWITGLIKTIARQYAIARLEEIKDEWQK